MSIELDCTDIIEIFKTHLSNRDQETYKVNKKM